MIILRVHLNIVLLKKELDDGLGKYVSSDDMMV
jgi:hypothetical protein